MRFSSLRIVQWSVIALVLAALVGLNYDFDSEAGMRINSSVEDPLSQSLRGYWKMDEGTGTNATDSSGNGNTLAFTGSPAWTTPAQIGPYMLDFSGTGQYLSVADPASGILDFAPAYSSNPISISGWFNRDTFTNDHTILAKKNAQGTDAGYVIYIDGTDDRLYITWGDGSTSCSFSSTPTFTTSGWHHFVFLSLAYNNAPESNCNRLGLYIDGVTYGDVGENAYVYDSSNALAFRIGAESDGGNPFDGKIDDIRIYGYTLSSSEIQKLYQTTAPAQPVDTGLVGHWTFDGPDIQGTTAIDRSGKGNNGTITGAVPALGKLGQGLSFDGTSDYVDAGDNNSLDFADGQDFSVIGWFKRSSNADWISLVGKRGDGTDGYKLFFASGNLWIQAWSPGGNYLMYAYESIPIGTWIHFAFIWDDDSENSTIIYFNGHPTPDGYYRVNPFLSVSNLSNSSPFIIGDESYSFHGSIDDIRIYNRALSASEILNLYTLGR